MYLKHSVLLALGPLFKNLNAIALICLLIFVNLGSAGKLPLLKRGSDSGAATHQNIEINLAQLALCQHLTVSPENLTLLVGGSGEMKCTCDSDLHSDFKWIQRTCTSCTQQQILQTDSENLNILRLENVTLGDEGWYTCLQGNNMGITSARAYLTVVTELPVDPIQLPMHGPELDRFIDNLVAAPDILNTYNNNNVGINNDEDDETRGMLPYFSNPDSMDRLVAKPSGNMLRLTCNAKGNPEPIITWTKDNETIIRQMGVAKYRKYALILEDLVRTDSGSYKCTACNEYGCIEHSTRLFVHDRFPARPYVKEGFPKNLTVLLNDTAEFHCPVISDLTFHIEWAKFRALNNNDTKVPVNVAKFQTDFENPEILRLYNVTFADEGWYTCYAANSLGTSAESAYLTVVSELPADEIKLPMRGLPIWLLILIIILASSFIIAVGVMCVIFKKLQIEKQNKNLNLEKVNMLQATK